MKKRVCQIILWCLLGTLIAGALLFFASGTKWFARLYVQLRREALTQYAHSLLAGKATVSTTYGPWTVTCWGDKDTPLVEFVTSSFGIVPSGNYKGFYYSPADQPMGFQGSDMDFTPSGNGWYWEEPDGDNQEYTEKIIKFWYWFEFQF